jgi:hypothetical protein
VSWLRVVAAVAARPGLWRTALHQARVSAPPGWWKRTPFLPVPSGDYLRFRLVTQYGQPQHRPEPDDVISYLTWCQQWNRAL